MGIAGISALNAANTAYEAAFQSLFSGLPSQVASQFTHVMNVPQAKVVNVPVIEAFPRYREWLGAKQFKDLKAYSFNIDLKKYEASIEIPRWDVEHDQTGAVAATLSAFVASKAAWLDDIVITSLLANPTCYTGDALLANTHVGAATGFTTDNLETTAFSFANYRTARDALRSMADASGKPLGVSPTHVLVGPLSERIALEVTGSDRPVTLSTAGGMDAGASVQAAVTLKNYIGGDCQVMVSEFITGNEWFVMDLSKPGLRPMLFCQSRPFQALSQTAMDDEGRFINDVFRYSIEGDGAPAAGLWQLIYGSVTA